jgi:hypothetical protein
MVTTCITTACFVLHYSTPFPFRPAEGPLHGNTQPTFWQHRFAPTGRGPDRATAAQAAVCAAAPADTACSTPRALQGEGDGSNGSTELLCLQGGVVSGQAARVGEAWLIGTMRGWCETVLVAAKTFLPRSRHFKFVKQEACAAASTDAACSTAGSLQGKGDGSNGSTELLHGEGRACVDKLYTAC